jgi:hypothetical protein
MQPEENTYCHYSDLPSPLAYMQTEEKQTEPKKENTQDELPTLLLAKNEETLKQSEPNAHA